MTAPRPDWPSERPAFSACSPGAAKTPTGARALTRRQLQVLQLFALGMPVKVVQEQLGISRQTVYRHTQDAYDKLGAMCREDAYAALGWLRVPEEAA